MDHLARQFRLLGCALGFFLLLHVLACAGLPLCCVFHGDALWWMNRVPFDPAAWKEADAEARYPMAWDLRAGLLHDKTAEEAVELLGEPTEKDRGGEEAGEIWYYDMGGEKYQFQFSPSSAALAVRFAEGRVVRVWKETW